MTNLYKLFILLFIFLFSELLHAGIPPTFNMVTRNITLLTNPVSGNDSIVEFEVYCQQTNFGQPGVDPFEYCCGQWAWYFNPAVVDGPLQNNGNVFFTLRSSSLPASLVPPSSAINNGLALLQTSGNLPNSSVNWFISSVFPGTFMAKYRFRTNEEGGFNVVPLNLRSKLGPAPNTFIAYFLPYADTVDTEVFPPPQQFAFSLMDTVANKYYTEDSAYMISEVIKLRATFAPEGRYNSIFNLLTKRDSVSVFLRRASAPFNIVDSSKKILDSITFSNIFNFYNAEFGRYYIVVKHYQCIETWSKSGGDSLIPNNPVYNYDFTTNSSQAYENNLKLKGSKYCIYSGDLNQDGFIRLDDVIQIYNDIVGFASGNTVTDLNGDKIVDLSDLLMVATNNQSFVRIRRP